MNQVIVRSSAYGVSSYISMGFCQHFYYIKIYTILLLVINQKIYNLLTNISKQTYNTILLQ